MSARAAIFAPAGPQLGPDEARFFAQAEPWGFILFARNVESPDQLRRLTADLRKSVGRDAPVLIDQEGGRVARMRSPHWQEWLPPLDLVARLPDPAAQARAIAARYRVIADELRRVGVDANCAPVLDIATPQTHPFLRNRCLGESAAQVARNGRAAADALLAGGVLPIIKHAPGHGRATQDSHLSLAQSDAPLELLAATDFAPFAALADMPLAMTGHILFPALDAENCATFSPVILRYLRHTLGFNGVLISDDLSMAALQGDIGQRAERALAAGCDIALHCNGKLDEMAMIAALAPVLDGAAAQRAARALAMRRKPEPCDLPAMLAEAHGFEHEVPHAR
ncbi:MAG: glycoside hydrolase family 3 N-terminal domain-containing protein [Paracoccaceae bacterium]